MKKKIFAVCDPEAEYTRRFCEYISRKKEYPFETAGFTSVEKLRQFCTEEEVEVLLISESAYDVTLKELVAGELIVLREEETAFSEQESIYKYQPCEAVLQEVMCYCAKQGVKTGAGIRRGSCKGMELIGLYTPVHRCMQTTFGITLGELLAKEHKVLYLNFESFSGLERRLNQEFMTDMSDLIYYVSNAREALVYKFQEMTHRLQRLDYIPPVFSCMDLARITKEQWFLMFEELERLTEYEYLILDLSENVQGLFEILRMCCKIFTLFRDDPTALAKLYQYEKLLERADYMDLLEKSRRCKLPFIKNISFDPLELTYGELADYVRRLIKEEINER